MAGVAAQASTVAVGVGVGLAALAARSAVQAFNAFKAGPQRFYKVSVGV